MCQSDGLRGCLVATAILLAPSAASTSAAQDVDFATPGVESVDASQQIGVPSGSPQEAAAAASRMTLPAVRSALADGDWNSARQRMLQLALLIGQTHDLRGLETVEKEILATTDTPALLGMGLVLFDVSSEALDARQYLVSTVMRRAAFGCLERLESARGVPTALMADVYTMIGARLQAAGSSSASGESFRRAVKLDPQLGSARLGLGIYFDQLGDTEEAISVFDGQPAVQPHHGEASLRKAVAQIQLGHDRSARKTLESLVNPRATSQPEPWVQSVAYQELAMLRLRKDGPLAARDVLQQGVERLPNDRRLYVMLAFVHNTLGRRGAAASVLRDMERNLDRAAEDGKGGEGGASSPRHRLAQWRLDVPVGLEDQIRRHAETAISTGRLAP